MPLDPELLYRQLGQLVAEIPLDLFGPGAISADTHRWLGRAAALIKESDDDPLQTDFISFRLASDHLQGVVQKHNAHQIVAILHRALARAEMKAPAAAQGAFIAAGAAFDVLQAVGKVLQEAEADILIVDPYMDHRALTDFAPLVPERVSLRLLADRFSSKPDALKPAAERWAKQYAALRPLEVRMSAPRALHDRLIFVDRGARTWSLTQSLKDFAARSPGSLLRVDDGEIAEAKLEFYQKEWAAAQPL